MTTIILGTLTIIIAVIYFVVGFKNNKHDKEINEMKAAANKVANELEQEAVAIETPIVKEVASEVKNKAKEVITEKANAFEQEILTSIDQKASTVLKPKTPRKKKN